MKYNVLLSQSSVVADMRLKSNARRFLEETQYLLESCMSFISFSLAVIFVMKLHKLVRFPTGVFLLLQCISLSSFHILCVLNENRISSI